MKDAVLIGLGKKLGELSSFQKQVKTLSFKAETFRSQPTFNQQDEMKYKIIYFIFLKQHD